MKHKFIEPYIGKQIRLRLEELGLNITDGAKKCNVNYMAFHRILRKNQNPSASTLLRIANGLNVSVDYLLKNERQCSSFTREEHDIICFYRDTPKKTKELFYRVAKRFSECLIEQGEQDETN